jgi:hypothetical protein
VGKWPSPLPAFRFRLLASSFPLFAFCFQLSVLSSPHSGRHYLVAFGISPAMLRYAAFGVKLGAETELTTFSHVLQRNKQLGAQRTIRVSMHTIHLMHIRRINAVQPSPKHHEIYQAVARSQPS